MKYFERCITCTEETGRYPGCQDHCEYGIAAKKKYIEDKAKILKVKTQEQNNRRYVYEKFEKARRK